MGEAEKLWFDPTGARINDLPPSTQGEHANHYATGAVDVEKTGTTI